MVYVFCAFYGECSDLIKHYNLKKRQSDKHYRFDVFENEVSPVKIIITGQGAVLAASAVSGAVSYFGIDGKDAIINIGTCAGNYEVGSVFLCNKITEYVTGRTFYPDMLIKCSIREGEIVTVSVPVKENDIALGKLYDMEAILGLNYFGDFLRIVEVECHSRIFGHKLPAAHETDFAATHGLGGFGI